MLKIRSSVEMGPGAENPLWQGMLCVEVDPGAENPTVY